MKQQLRAVASVAALMLPHASKSVQAQVRASDAEACTNGAPLSGIARDATGATVAEAAVTLDDGTETHTSANGRFAFKCVSAGAHKLHVAAESFAALDVDVPATRKAGDLAIVLRPESVAQTVDVEASATRGVDATETGVSRVLQGDDLKALADDPDDLLRELQQLSAGAGGNPADARITVDGFQGASRLPPKSSIAYIKVNPDLFSAEYQEPPYTGGRIEVYTKPGQPRIHGALFLTYGGSALNASDPFSISKGKIGKRRYGFDLSGPVRRQGSDFALNLEHRSIDSVSAVNAVTLDSAGNTVPLLQTVQTPESLWNGSARLAWQLGPKNTFTGTYTANDNTRANQGVGGSTLQEAGRNVRTYEHTLRFIDITTASANLMYQSRVGLRWLGDLSAPNSTAPQLQVAGAFTGGGAELGRQQVREAGLELSEDIIWTHGAHTIKGGLNLRSYREREQMTQNFNGTYIFGGGSAPALDASGNALAGGTATISGLEQYRRARLGLAGGTPTAYTAVTGSPDINFTQTRIAVYAQDDWKLRPNLKLSYGARYYAQNDPKTLLNLVPRVGIAWSPDKAQKWTIKAHAGMFSDRYSTEDWTELRRLDGTERVSSTVYSPVYGNPLTGSTPIRTVRTTAPGFSNGTFSEEQVEVDRSLRGGWNVQGTFYWLRGWNFARSANINSPLYGQPNGPRPGAANLNVLQAQNSGSMKGDIEFVSVEQHKLKWLGIYVGYARVDLRDNADNNTFFTPQTSGSNAGEYARRSRSDQHQIFGSGNLHLPYKVDLDSNYYVGSGSPFNITTGFDNNGDGNFNDRPTYARAGDPTAVRTQYGTLVATGGTGVVPRNTGTMPFRVNLDANLSRSFVLTPHASKESLQTLAVNVRSANLLNHTNVRQVGGVLGSPLFGRAYQADSGRRIELGLRYSF
ncbi:MAG: TonB-dependent receptor domain-containing protein [Janthinobacterium lividum]